MARCLVLFAALCLSACASHPASSSGGGDHPANPDAATAARPSDASASAPAAPEHNHAGHHHDEPGDATASPGAMYMCPMHPAVTSGDPNARCPECGMKINKKINPENPK